MSDRNLRQEPTTVLAALLTMRELLADPKCWTKNVYYRPVPRGKPQRCLLGALNTTTHTQPLYAQCVSILHSVLPAPLKNHGDISLFNDTPGTTHEMVIDLLDKAISKAMQEVT